MGMEIEGELVKRWRVSYGGTPVGDWDTAQEAWDGYREHDDKIRPLTEQGPSRKYRYAFFDGQKELDIAQFRAAIAAEKRGAQK